jgi:hypothetical protein
LWDYIVFQPLEEIDKNGPNVLTEVELNGHLVYSRPTIDGSSCSREIYNTENQDATIYSRSLSKGRNQSAPVPVMKIAGTLKGILDNTITFFKSCPRVW